MAAAETSARSASCCSDSPRCSRSSRSFGPIELTMRSRVEPSPSDTTADSAAVIDRPLTRPSLTGGRNQYSQCLLTFRECPVGLGASPAPVGKSPRRRAVTPKTVARTVIVGGGAGGIGAAGAAKAADRQGEVDRLHRVRGRRLQPLRHPLRARPGDPRLRAPVPGRQGGLRRGRDRHPLQHQGDGHRPRPPAGDRRGRGRRRLGPAGHRHRLRLRRPRRAGLRPRGPVLRQEHPPGHGVGQGPRPGQGAP